MMSCDKDYISIYHNVPVYFQAVGCDGIVGSGTRKDHCGVCGGDNDSCRIIRGIFTRSHLDYGYNQITRIPKGACHINVTELNSSRNYLGKFQRGLRGLIHAIFMLCFRVIHPKASGTSMNHNNNPMLLEVWKWAFVWNAMISNSQWHIRMLYGVGGEKMPQRKNVKIPPGWHRPRGCIWMNYGNSLGQTLSEVTSTWLNLKFWNGDSRVNFLKNFVVFHK